MPGPIVNPYRFGGGGGGAYVPSARTLGAHRYWRVNITANNGSGFVVISEIEMRTSIGGADVTGSGTATASHDQGGSQVPSAAFDNNTGTEWAAAWSGGPEWIKYDFGAGNDKNIVEVVMTSHSGAGFLPTSFEIQWSDDNTNWTGTKYNCSINDWPVSTAHSFAISSVSYRCHITDTGAGGGAGGSPFIAELSIAQTTGGTNECLLQAHATAGANNDLQNAELARDGNGGTGWQSGSTPTGDLIMHFPSAINFQEAAITISTANSTVPRSFTFDVSVDGGATWTTIVTPTTQTGWSNNETRTFTYP